MMNAVSLSKITCTQVHHGAGAARLLIISDSADRSRAFKSALSKEAFVVLEARTVAEVRAACRGGLALAILDAGAPDVVALLCALRTSAGCERIPLLVDINTLPDADRGKVVL